MRLLTILAAVLLLSCSVLISVPDKQSGSDTSVDTDEELDIEDDHDAADVETEPCTPQVIGPVRLSYGAVGRHLAGGTLAWSGSTFGTVWADQRHGADQDEVYFSVLDAAGTIIRGDVRLTEEVAQSKYPGIVWADSEFGIVWTDLRNGMSGDIYFARIDGGGVRIGGDVAMIAEAECQSTARLAWDGTRFGVAWYYAPEGTGPYAIHFGCATAQGEMISRTELSGTSMLNPQIAWSESEYGVVWRAYDGVNAVYFTRVSADGTQIGAPELLDSSSDNALRRPDIAWDGSSYGVVWWEEVMNELHFSAVDITGAITTSERIIGTGISPSIDKASSAFSIGYIHNGDVMLTQLDESGSTFGEELQVTDGDGSSSWPTIVWTSSEYGVVWQDNKDGDDFNIYFARVKPCDGPGG